MARQITETEIKELLKLKEKDITLKKLRELFASTESRDAKFNTNDFFRLPIRTLYNKSAMTTTVGRFIINTLILNPSFGKHIEYINFPLNGKGLGKLESQLSNLLLDDKITVTEFSEFIDKIQWLGFSITDFINPPLTTDLLIAPENVKKRKEEILKDEKVQERLKNADINLTSEIETELLDMAEKELKDLPDKDIYDSGSRGSWSNNFKMTAIGRGAVKSLSDPNKVDISMASLDEGIPPEERHIYADILATASYSRSIMTRMGGYEAKKLAASFQGVILDKPDSNCNTSLTVPLQITKDNTSLLGNRYIEEGSELVLLTDENISKYIGKTVNLRSPMYCKSDQICNKCAGELYYKLGIENVGLISNVIGTSITNLAMKSFHDTSITVHEIDPFAYIE